MGGSQSLPNLNPCVKDQVGTVQERSPEGAGTGVALTFIKDLVDAEASRPQLHLAQAPGTSEAQTSQIMCSRLRKDYGSLTTYLGAVTRGLWAGTRGRTGVGTKGVSCTHCVKYGGLSHGGDSLEHLREAPELGKEGAAKTEGPEMQAWGTGRSESRGWGDPSPPGN